MVKFCCLCAHIATHVHYLMYIVLAIQEKIVPGNKILITTENESVAASSLVLDKTLSAEEAGRAVVVSHEDDHTAGNIRLY